MKLGKVSGVSGAKVGRRAQATQSKNSDANSSSESLDELCVRFEQCHRNFPNSQSCNVHKHKEGFIYRAHVARAQVHPSMGGGTLIGSFSTIATIVAKRKRFAHKCVGLVRNYGFGSEFIYLSLPDRGRLQKSARASRRGCDGDEVTYIDSFVGRLESFAHLPCSTDCSATKQ